MRQESLAHNSKSKCSMKEREEEAWVGVVGGGWGWWDGGGWVGAISGRANDHQQLQQQQQLCHNRHQEYPATRGGTSESINATITLAVTVLIPSVLVLFVKAPSYLY